MSFCRSGGGGMGMNMNMQGGGNNFGNMAGNNNINTGHMDGGSQVQTTNGKIKLKICTRRVFLKEIIRCKMALI